MKVLCYIGPRVYATMVTDRQNVLRQTDHLTHRVTDRKADRQIVGQTNRHGNTQTGSYTERSGRQGNE